MYERSSSLFISLCARFIFVYMLNFLQNFTSVYTLAYSAHKLRLFNHIILLCPTGRLLNVNVIQGQTGESVIYSCDFH